MPTVKTFCSSKQCCMIWSSISTHACQPTMDVGSQYTFLPQEPHGPSLSMITSSIVHDSATLIGAIVLLKKNPYHPLLLSTGWMFNYSCLIIRTIFEWQGFSIDTLQQVPIIYEWPLYLWIVKSICHSCSLRHQLFANISSWHYFSTM
jgi:hypothetical protein